MNAVKDGFFGQAHFPNVIGCIDCRHVRIQGPSEDEPAFVKRKGFHSINVQAVCDHEGKFTKINANWPGSVHDSHNRSTLFDYLENHHRGLLDGVLLGDGGYACRTFLMTPYHNPQEPNQIRYNRSHGSTISSIERCFGILKRQFHVLHSEMRMEPEKLCRVICACAVLHNIAIMLEEPLIDDGNDEDKGEQNAVPVTVFDGAQDGRATREHIARTYFG